MNYARVLLGDIVGGIVFSIVSLAINIAVLGSRYQVLQTTGVFRQEPRLPFLPLHILVMFGMSIGLVWLYAASRARLGPGPSTALCVGLVVGLLGAVPGFLNGYSWTYEGGFVNLWWAIERIVGCAA